MINIATMAKPLGPLLLTMSCLSYAPYHDLVGHDIDDLRGKKTLHETKGLSIFSP